jgi:hypothetical protein
VAEAGVGMVSGSAPVLAWFQGQGQEGAQDCAPQLSWGSGPHSRGGLASLRSAALEEEDWACLGRLSRHPAA